MAGQRPWQVQADEAAAVAGALRRHLQASALCIATVREAQETGVELGRYERVARGPVLSLGWRVWQTWGPLQVQPA
eukprot:27597-Chlamydomonas_euryale.AAC.7